MAVNQKSIENLQPPKPGEVRNPKGKPKGTLSAKTIIRKWLESKEKIVHPISKKEIKVTVLDSITLALIGKARKGDVAAFNALLDRIDGKPKQEMGFTDNDGNDVVGVLVYVPDNGRKTEAPKKDN